MGTAMQQRSPDGPKMETQKWPETPNQQLLWRNPDSKKAGTLCKTDFTDIQSVPKLMR